MAKYHDCPSTQQSTYSVIKIILLQLRYLQTLNNIAAENNSTVIFPVPVDVISQLMGKDKVSVICYHIIRLFIF